MPLAPDLRTVGIQAPIQIAALDWPQHAVVGAVARFDATYMLLPGLQPGALAEGQVALVQALASMTREIVDQDNSPASLRVSSRLSSDSGRWSAKPCA